MEDFSQETLGIWSKDLLQLGRGSSVVESHCDALVTLAHSIFVTVTSSNCDASIRVTLTPLLSSMFSLFSI